MERILLARHAESELSMRGIVNGDPQVRCGLTPAGELQAQQLRQLHAETAVELVVTSDFERCRCTADAAVDGRAVRRLELPALGDIRCGRFEGGPLDAYREWAWSAPAAEPAAGGGDSRVAAAARIAAGLRELLAQPERTALVVTHRLVVAYVLRAGRGEPPARRIEPVPYAEPVELSAATLERAAATLEAWAESPDW